MLASLVTIEASNAFDAHPSALPRANLIRRGRTAVLVRFPNDAKRRGVVPLSVT